MHGKWKISPENSGTNEFPLSKLFRNLENIFIPTGYLAVCRLLFEWNLSEIISRNLQTLQTWTLWFKQDSIAKSIARFDCKSQNKIRLQKSNKIRLQKSNWRSTLSGPKGREENWQSSSKSGKCKIFPLFIFSSFHIMIEVSHCCPGRFELWRWTQETPPTAAKWGSTSKHY